MSGDLKEQPTVAPRVHRLSGRRTAKRDTAKDKRPGVVSELLFILIPLLADELDGFQVFKPALGNSDRGQHGLQGSERETSRVSRGRRLGFKDSHRCVPKVCQKSQ